MAEKIDLVKALTFHDCRRVLHAYAPFRSAHRFDGSSAGRAWRVLRWQFSLQSWRVQELQFASLAPCIENQNCCSARVHLQAAGKVLCAIAHGDNIVLIDEGVVCEKPMLLLNPHTLDGHSEAVTSVAFSPDGQRVASASRDLSVRLWRVSSCSCIWAGFKHESEVCR
jgi:WD40 repeat protein